MQERKTIMENKENRKPRNLKKMIYQADGRLKSMCRFGESKKNTKIINRKQEDVRNGKKALFHERIFSYRTYRKYLEICITFLNWCSRRYPQLDHYRKCRKYVGCFLRDCFEKGLSIKTTANYRVALVKLYGLSPDDYKIVKIYGHSVSIDDFRKYRYLSRDSKNWFRKENYLLTVLIVCTGLRRNEARNLRGDALIRRNGGWHLHVTVGSKGGRERYARIIGTEEEISIIVQAMKVAEKKRIFDSIPKDYSYHVLRSIYACRYIDMVAADTDMLPEKDKYRFKGEYRDFCVSRKGVKEVSESLGHNRISVIRYYFRRTLFKGTHGKTGMELVKEVYDLMERKEKFA